MAFALDNLTPSEEMFLKGPAAPLPPGAVPGQNTAMHNAYWIATPLFFAASILAVAMRLFTRIVIAKSFFLEDGLIVFALGTNIAELVIYGYVVSIGGCNHMWDITGYNFLHGLYYLSYSDVTYCLGMLFVKVAISLQFLRLFVPDRRLNLGLWLACWLAIIANGLFYGISLFVQTFQCLPRAKMWNPFIRGGHCLNAGAIYRTTGVFNVISDFALFFIPIWAIYQLQMKIESKLAVGSLFAAGLLACVASIARTYYTFVGDKYDLSWASGAEGYALEAELALGLLVFCLPVAPQFSAYAVHKIRSSSIYNSVSSQALGSRSKRKQGSAPPDRQRHDNNV